MGGRSLFRADDRRPPRARAAALTRQAFSTARLPPPVAAFYLRALRRARRTGDQWTLDVVCRPAELVVLLDALRACRRVAEVGTASAWTTIALALARADRRVVSYDVEAHPERERYLALVPADARARIELHPRPGGVGPDEPPAVEGVFIDSSHEREETIATFRLWERVLPPGGVVVFHDFRDPAYPGVTEAIRELGLRGRGRGRAFVWCKA